MTMYLVEAANGEAYALREDFDSALHASVEARAYLVEAETSGHPIARAWVKERLPFRVREISADERDGILEDGTPVLDREP